MSELGKPIHILTPDGNDPQAANNVLNEQAIEAAVQAILAKAAMAAMTPEERAEYDAHIALNLAACKVLDQLHGMHHAVGLNAESWIATSAFDENQECFGFAVVWMGPKAVDLIRAFNRLRGDPDPDAGTVHPSKLPVHVPDSSVE